MLGNTNILNFFLKLKNKKKMAVKKKCILKNVLWIRPQDLNLVVTINSQQETKLTIFTF